MAKADIAALLALGAALLIAIGDVLHQRSAHEVTDQPVGHIGLFTRLLRDTRWWSGTLVSAAGFGLQAAALGLGSVLLVQALLVTSLLFALPINAHLAGHRVTRAEWRWAALLAAAVAVIVGAGHPTAGQSRASLGTWIAVAAVFGPVVVLCMLGARYRPGRVAAVLLAVVSASSWGLFAVLTKGVVDLLGHGPLPLLRSPELYGWLVVATAGTVFQQSSFRAGALTVTLPTMTVTEPVVASGLGVALLGEVLRPGKVGWVTLVAAVVVMIVATAALARDEAADAQLDRPDDMAAVADRSSGR
ncbi:DMT family transporter [Mycobacterium talmoniae]|uniref:Uncharacterized protein n=1 Tax=Mycobacterium talmoniae TaxID=1858794 RepID=A0A1S1MUZ3_9MYCO|nr:DMT family transporter [Mycobacterium talmoniae]OHU90519.1 hypothetical protein BKN37_25520 [Mycobacterium talmoniae]